MSGRVPNSRASSRASAAAMLARARLFRYLGMQSELRGGFNRKGLATLTNFCTGRTCLSRVLNEASRRCDRDEATRLSEPPHNRGVESWLHLRPRLP